MKVVFCLYVTAKSDNAAVAFGNFFCWCKPASILQGFEIPGSKAGSKHFFVTETQLPKSESSYKEKDDVVSKWVPWDVVSLFNSSFLVNWGSPTPTIHLQSLHPLRWFNSLMCQKTTQKGKNPPHIFFVWLLLIVSSKCHNKDKAHDCTTGSWRGEFFEQKWAVTLSHLLRES